MIYDTGQNRAELTLVVIELATLWQLKNGFGKSSKFNRPVGSTPEAVERYYHHQH